MKIVFIVLVTTVLRVLGPTYNELKDVKETTCNKWVLVVTELFNTAFNDFEILLFIDGCSL